MQFHDYTSSRNRMARYGHDLEARRIAKSLSSADFRQFFLDRLRGSEKLSDLDFQRFMSLSSEMVWVNDERPYYNVWPIVLDLISTVKLDLPFSSVQFPFPCMLFRFALGNEPGGVATSLVWWPDTSDDTVQAGVCCFFPGSMDVMSFQYTGKCSDTIESWLARAENEAGSKSGQHTMRKYSHARFDHVDIFIRLCVFVGLLSHETDLITPIVLAKDRNQYEDADPDTRRWLEERATRKLGRGFEFGKKLQEERDSSPHWRNPHLTLFWTGEGRTVPILKMRRGSLVQPKRVSMADVPTGFLGPERDDEEQGSTFIYFIEAIGHDRIKIGKADNPEVRLKQLQTGSHAELRLIGTIAAEAAREQEMHQAFATDRIRGEWFAATPELREYIRNSVTPL